MAVITRFATIVESPDPSQGGGGVNSPSTSGHGITTASASSSNGSPPQDTRRTCRWRNFGPPVGGVITKIQLKYSASWSISGTAELFEESGFAACSASYSLDNIFTSDGASISGPGPLPPETFSQSDGGDFVTELPVNTDLSALQMQTELFAHAESNQPFGGAGAGAQTDAIVSGILVEITTSDGAPIVFM